MASPFSSVPRPGESNVSQQMSSWMSSVKDAGASALSKVKENQQLQSISVQAGKLGENVTGAVRSTPLGTVGSAAAAQAESMKTLITGQQKEPESVSQYVDEAMTLSYKKRLAGFAICLASGLFFMGLSTLMLPLLVFKPHKFAVAYTLGNLLMMASTIFLVGPKQQCQNMWTGNRALASCAYFGSVIGTIYAALFLRIYLLVLFFIAVQIGCVVWYALSYIPFGRQLVSKFLKPILKGVSSCVVKVGGLCCSQCAPNILPR